VHIFSYICRCEHVTLVIGRLGVAITTNPGGRKQGTRSLLHRHSTAACRRLNWRSIFMSRPVGCLVGSRRSRVQPDNVVVGEWSLVSSYKPAEIYLRFCTPRPTAKLENPSSAVRDCLFNIFAATLHVAGRSTIRNLRTRNAVVTRTHLTWA
jgi:hypothetical protein